MTGTRQSAESPVTPAAIGFQFFPLSSEYCSEKLTAGAWIRPPYGIGFARRQDRARQGRRYGERVSGVE